jgi:hypothetical protein
LTNIGGNASFQGSSIKDLGKLKGIGGNVAFRSKTLQSLGSLTAIGGYVDFEFSHIKSLGNLYYVGSDVLLQASEIVDLGNLTIVGGEVVFGENQDMLKKQWEYQEKINGLKSQLENSRLPKELREKIEDELDAYEEAKKEIQNNGKLFNNGGNINMINQEFARGGKVIVEKNDLQKFAKIGLDNKYDIESIKDIGLQGLPFTKEAILKKIQDEFDVLTETYEDYIISEDSDAITKTIQNTIETLKRDGRPQDNINVYERALTNPRDRQRYIDDFAKNQEETLEKWVSYLKQSSYVTSFKYLLLKAVLKFNYDFKLDKLIERNNKTIRNFTQFDASIIGQLVIDESDFLLKDYIAIQVKNSFSIVNSKEAIKKSGNGRWIKFDGGSDVDEKIIEKNANELSQLVQNTYWCTKTNAYSQLEDGDFYVYVTEKDNELFPRIAIRMEGDEVGEVRGNKSSAQDIEEEMLPIAEDFLINNIPNNSGKEWLDSIAYNQKVVDFTKKIAQDGLSKGDFGIYMELIRDEEKFTKDYGGSNSNVNYLTGTIKDLIENEKFNKGFEYKKDEFDLYGGNYSNIEATKKYKVSFEDINNYNEEKYPNLEIVLGNLRSDSNGKNYDLNVKGFGKIRYIGGWFNYGFQGYQIETLGNIEFVGGQLFFNDSLKDFGNLEYCGGDITIPKGSSIKSFGKIKTVEGDFDIKSETQIEDLGLIENVGGLYIDSPKIKSLGKIKKLDTLYLGLNSNIQDLGSLEEIDGRLDIDGSKSLKSLGKLKKVDDLIIEQSQIEDLGELEVITGEFYLNKKVKSLGKLKSVGDLDLRDSILEDLGNIEKVNNLYLEGNKKIKSLGKLKRIEADATFNDNIEDLGNLEYIGGDTDFQGCKKIKSLKKLKTIGGDLLMSNSSIEDLGNLESIGGDFDMENSNIETFGKLKKIGGKCAITKKIKSLGKLEYVDGILDLSESSIENLGNLQKVHKLWLNKKVKDLGKIVEINELRIWNTIDFKGLKLIKSLDCNGFESEKPIEITLPKVDSIKELYLYNVNVDEISIKQIGNLYVALSKVNVLKDIDELDLLEISESTIKNIENVNLNDTKIKYEISDETKKLIGAYKRGEKKEKDTKLEKIKKYEKLIENLKNVLNDKSLNDVEKVEVREAIESYEEFILDIKNTIRFEDGGHLKFDNGGNVKKVDSGGITYGASHDNGGIPVKNASTGEMLEVEGGEGIVNKRSMASEKIVKLNGKEMSICEAVSKLNEMEGGVKFSCDDVEDRQFIEEMEYGGELERGTRTEMEHIQVLKDLYAKRITPKEATEKIAKDHIKENPHYYTDLAKVEKKMANGGKSDCGCSHSQQFENGGQTTDCGCSHKKYNRGGDVFLKSQNKKLLKKYDNGGELSDSDRILQRLREMNKPKDPKQDLIDQTLTDARRLVDIDYKEQLKNLPPEYYDKIKNFGKFNLYSNGWRCQYSTSKTYAGVCVHQEDEESEVLLKSNHIYISIDFVKNEKNWKDRYKDVVLHEIAHAIVQEYFIKPIGYLEFVKGDPMHFLTNGHGETWKAVCSAINPNGNCDQFYKNALLSEEHKEYMYECANCGNKKYGNSPTFAKVCNKCFKSIFVEKNNE